MFRSPEASPWVMRAQGGGRCTLNNAQAKKKGKKPQTTGHGEAECKCRFRLWRCVAVAGKGKQMQRNERRERRSRGIQDRERSGHSTACSVSAVVKPQKIPIRMKLKLMDLTAGQSLQTHAVQPCTVKTQKNCFDKIQETSKLLIQANASLRAGAHHRGRR